MSDTAIVSAWVASASVIVALSTVAGLVATKRAGGLLIDSRGRYSLAHMQVALWTIVMMSLILGTVLVRSIYRLPEPLDFEIPTSVLAVLGLSLSSGVLSTAIKVTKDRIQGDTVAASLPADNRPIGNFGVDELMPRLLQVFTKEEGASADRAVDVMKFQNFVVTFVLVISYITSAIRELRFLNSSVPAFNQSLLTLLAMSHIAYLLGKLPPQSGYPPLSVVERNNLLASRHKAPRVQPRRQSAQWSPVAPKRRSRVGTTGKRKKRSNVVDPRPRESE